MLVVIIIIIVGIFTLIGIFGTTPAPKPDSAPIPKETTEAEAGQDASGTSPIIGTWIHDVRISSGKLVAWFMIEFRTDGLCIATTDSYNSNMDGCGGAYYSIVGNKIIYKHDDGEETYNYSISGENLEIETPFAKKQKYRRATDEEQQELHAQAKLHLGILK